MFIFKKRKKIYIYICSSYKDIKSIRKEKERGKKRERKREREQGREGGRWREGAQLCSSWPSTTRRHQPREMPPGVCIRDQKPPGEKPPKGQIQRLLLQGCSREVLWPRALNLSGACPLIRPHVLTSLFWVPGWEAKSSVCERQGCGRPRVRIAALSCPLCHPGSGDQGKSDGWGPSSWDWTPSNRTCLTWMRQELRVVSEGLGRASAACGHGQPPWWSETETETSRWRSTMTPRTPGRSWGQEEACVHGWWDKAGELLFECFYSNPFLSPGWQSLRKYKCPRNKGFIMDHL